MQFITILAVLAPAMAGVSAKCVDHPYNAYWPKDRAETKSHAAKFCKSQLSGSFQQNAQKWACGNIVSDRKAPKSASFMVQWTGKAATATLAEADCVLRLTKEIDGCDKQGGETTTADWKFKAVPQYAAC